MKIKRDSPLMNEYLVKFPDSGTEVYAVSGTNILECALRAGIQLNSPCAGAGTCGKCVVRVIRGKLHPSPECIQRFSGDEISDGYRLACRTRVEGDLTIEIPRSSLLQHNIAALHETGYACKNTGLLDSPLAEKRKLRIPQPSLENPLSELDCLKSEMPGVAVTPGPELMGNLTNILHSSSFECTAVISEHALLAIEPPGNSANFAAAIDLGTTTLAAALIELPSGRQLVSGAILNPQVKFGADVLSRICAQSESAAKLAELKKCVIDALNDLLSDLAEKAGVKTHDIYAVTIAGNTVMQHLLCGIPAKHLGEIPFAPVVSEALHLKINDIPLNTSKTAAVYIFPVLGGFIGGDITAGLISSGFTTEPHSTALFIDIGTNGEIVLKHNGLFLATAAAAGPAFEGAGIESGMRAAPGAIEKIAVDNGDLIYNVIGNCTPSGICGSALIDLTAELLRHGILDETGRFLSPEEAKKAPDPLKQRITAGKDEGTYDFLIHEEVYLRQKDIRQLQLAAGAIRAATNILLKKGGITADEIEKVYIAGGFGNFIRRSNAKRIGVIPDIENSRVNFVGNTSLLGAKLATMDSRLTAEAEKLRKTVKCVDVSLDPEFQLEFASAMIFS